MSSGPACARASCLLIGLLLTLLSGCSSWPDHYLRLDDRLRTGQYTAADELVAKAQDEYGSKRRVLYGMDRGLTLQLAGRYEDSTRVLSEAEDEVERLFTRKIRNEVLAFLVNDNELPFEGRPYEQVMINVLKAINYAIQQNWQDAMVEARRLDYHLNVLADRKPDGGEYRDDGFARYLTGVLYEAGGDLNNALVAYRRAEDAYRAGKGTRPRGVPRLLQSDLLRLSEALGLTDEVQRYRQEFPQATWLPHQAERGLAQVVLISYNGRAPSLANRFLDIPLGLDAARLVLLSRGLGGGTEQSRSAESLLYGLRGQVVRIAVPRLVPQPTAIVASEVELAGGERVTKARTELLYDSTALAEQSLAERLPGLMVRTAARAAIKYGLAEGVERGLRSATRGRNGRQDDMAWVGIVVGTLLRVMAVASEEADTRSWSTLPGDIQVARLWVPPGDYTVRVQPISRVAGPAIPSSSRGLTLREGETRVLLEPVLQ